MSEWQQQHDSQIKRGKERESKMDRNRSLDNRGADKMDRNRSLDNRGADNVLDNRGADNVDKRQTQVGERWKKARRVTMDQWFEYIQVVDSPERANDTNLKRGGSSEHT